MCIVQMQVYTVEFEHFPFDHTNPREGKRERSAIPPLIEVQVVVAAVNWKHATLTTGW